MMEWRPGDAAIWHGVYPGGYGYRFATPVTVLRLGAKRVLVEATITRPTQQTVTRWVEPKSLTRRDTESTTP